MTASGRAAPARRTGGFTLIEVLVALAVFAVAATALVQAGAQRAEGLAYLRDRTLTSWIAANRIAALRLQRHWDTGNRDGQVEMAGQTWYWRAEISGTANAAVHRVEIAVAREPDAEPVTRLTGFLGDPADIAAGEDADDDDDTGLP